VYEIENPIGARENSIRGYKENMPGYPLANESRGIYHKFTFGNAEIFALDLRAQKSPALEPFKLNSSTNKWEFNPPEGHTIIGRDESVGEGESQLDWFLNALRNSTADWKFIMSSVPFNIGQKAALDMGIQLQDFAVPIEGAPEGTTAIAASFELADGWSGFPEDSKTILDFIDNNNITNVIVLSGDSHNAAIDDGTNAGLPEIMAGNLDITNSKTITFFESFGIQIWNKGGHGISTEEFNDAFGKVTVFGSDSVKLQLIDEFGTLFADHSVISEKITSVASEKGIYNFHLTQNYPNPFNPLTKIKYTLARSGHVTLKIFDVLGREIITLVNRENSAGSHEVFFDASQFASGTYFYTLSSGKYFESKKMIYLK
jgi:phosphodiesterase/alkaline phosphatase D-like protein